MHATQRWVTAAALCTGLTLNTGCLRSAIMSAAPSSTPISTTYERQLRRSYWACNHYLFGFIPVNEQTSLENIRQNLSTGSDGLVDVEVRSVFHYGAVYNWQCWDVKATPFKWLTPAPKFDAESFEKLMDDVTAITGAASESEAEAVQKGVIGFEELMLAAIARENAAAAEAAAQAQGEGEEGTAEGAAETEAASEEAVTPVTVVGVATAAPPKRAEALVQKLYQIVGKTPPQDDVEWDTIVRKIWTMRQQNSKTDAQMVVLVRTGTSLQGPDADLLSVLEAALDEEQKR